MKGQSSFDNIDELFALGLSSVGLDDYGRADAAVRELSQAEKALPDKDAADLASIMRQQMEGLLAIARGDPDGGLKTLHGAAQREAARPKPIARPYPPKPAGELYAEALHGLGNPREAVAEYRRVLERTPRRAKALLGLARALAASGQTVEASRTARTFLEMWKSADPDRPELSEARQIAR
jgi:tetratricopeptide (TPR) repeat protein